MKFAARKLKKLCFLQAGFIVHTVMAYTYAFVFTDVAYLFMDYMFMLYIVTFIMNNISIL